MPSLFIFEVKDLTMVEKQAYEEKFKAQLKELDAKIDVLKANAEHVRSVLKSDYYETIEDLEQKRAEAQDKLQELSEASGVAREQLKQDVEEKWTSFATAVKSAFSRFQ